MKQVILMMLCALLGVSAGAQTAESLAPQPGDEWAQVRISVANMRTEPRHGGELDSQVIMGMPVRVLEKKGEWWRVESPEGYAGWVTANSLEPKSAKEMEAWRADDTRQIVSAPYQTRVYYTSELSGLRNVVTDVVNGCILELTDPSLHGMIEAARATGGHVSVPVRLPDGREGYIDAADITDITEWAAQPFDAQKILDLAYSMEGQPYLWGGTSTKSLDCSGLVKVCYLSNGLILKRNASQQARTGTKMKAKDWPKFKAGDLLFFGNPNNGKVTHVAIYDHDGRYVHSSGRVKRNSVDPKSDMYLTTPFLHAVRIHGNEGTDGIIRAQDHPWLFNK